jgi:DNA-binding transcriptional MerR regulator
VTVRAVRHYHAKGLLPEPERDHSGYRRYDPAAVVELIRIRTLAEAGVPLSRVQELLAADDEEFAAAVEDIDRRLRAEIRERQRLRERITQLRAGDSLALPPEAVAYLDRLRELDLPERAIDLERDAWILVAAQLTEQMPTLMALKSAQLGTPAVTAIYLDLVEAAEWTADDPRLPAFADRLASHPLAVRSHGSSPTVLWSKLRGGDLVTGSAAQTGKADFSHIYNRPDPRDYFCTLSRLDYEIPHRARPVFETVFSAIRTARDASSDQPLHALDLCCSYGVNAALLRCDLDLQDLFDRYSDPDIGDLDPEQVCTADKDYYADRIASDALRVSGLDAAANAVAYACRVGLLDNGWAENLEANPPTDELARALAHVDVVTCTGGIGYITERTLGQVVRTRPGRPAPWVAAFVLRQYSYEPISAALAQQGLATEQLHGASFPQRRFASDAEREATLRAVTRRGLDPSGQEDTGRYYADFYLSRPDRDCHQPLNSLLADVVP